MSAPEHSEDFRVVLDIPDTHGGQRSAVNRYERSLDDPVNARLIAGPSQLRAIPPVLLSVAACFASVQVAAEAQRPLIPRKAEPAAG